MEKPTFDCEGQGTVELIEHTGSMIKLKITANNGEYKVKMTSHEVWVHKAQEINYPLALDYFEKRLTNELYAQLKE